MSELERIEAERITKRYKPTKGIRTPRKVMNHFHELRKKALAIIPKGKTTRIPEFCSQYPQYTTQEIHNVLGGNKYSPEILTLWENWYKQTLINEANQN